MVDLTATGIGTFVGALLAAFGVNTLRSLLRLNGQIKYWKAKAGESIEGGIAIDPFEDIERRLNDKLQTIEKRAGCEFSEMFQGHVKCTHDVISKNHMTTKELMGAIDEHIVSMAQLSQFLKSLNGRLKIVEDETNNAED